MCLTLLLTSLTVHPGLLPAQETDRPKAESMEKEAVVLAREGGLDKAIEAIRESLKADPSYASAYIQLGGLLLKKGLLEEAFQAFDDALRINPGLHSAKTGKGMVLSRKGDLEGAEVILKDALTLNPDPIRAHYELGLVYSKRGETTKALAEYKEGIKKYRQGRK